MSLFLDEAHRLPKEVFPIIRTLFDLAGVTIVMCGAFEILDRIDDTANAKGQMARRCVRYNAIEHVYNAEGPTGERRGKPLFSAKEIEQVFAKMKVRLTDDGLQLAWALACLPGRGCLGMVRQVVQYARQMYPSEEVSRKDILGSLPLLFGKQGLHMAGLADQHIEVMSRVA